ncbi:MAG TPA: hypothetical protein VFU63_08275 [Ktedonobacterales bacterium]|nr:hypothetical protein [Ktedonobacterales bacterium]
MSHFDVVLLALATLIEQRAYRLSTALRLVLPLASVGGFFGNLYGQLTLFAGAMTVFFFALAALFYGASIIMSSERARSHAIASIYGALIGLALALLAGTAAGIVSSAAHGQ